MRIGIDARELGGHATGVGRYLGGLLREWSASAAARRHEFVLYAANDIPISLDTRRFATRVVRGSGGTLWEQLRVPRVAARDHLDVWFSPAYSMPLTLRVPGVVAVHDLSFVAHPEWFRLREGARRRLLCRRAVDRARAVLTISAFSKRELVERLNVQPDRIHVIPPGVEAAAATVTSSVEPNILFVGSIFNRRHLPDLIRAFAPIARKRAEASLDLVGDNRSYPHEDIASLIAQQGLERQVQWHQYVSDEQLRQLFARARAFAFLSEYEGLGLPPLEALAAGVPPVLLDTAVARESCGDAAVYVPQGDIAATTRALERLLFDEEQRRRILDARTPVLSRYAWPEAAARTLALLETCADTNGPAR
ncbi:MAG TPA: glycosyltransferase family 1 protein [Vicinamibacterales bacterium]|jgi:glycosyltransferase involved in cell wall biosynthesis